MRKKTSDATKATRASSRKRCETRKNERRDAQRAAEARNRKTSASGSLTPWQQSKRARAIRRAGKVSA